jgi:hypothetical protein
MARTSTEGTAKGFAERDYTEFGSRVPVLRSFYFSFNHNQTGDTDNHLNSAMLLPGGRSRDLSPDAENQPADVDDGRLQVMYRDQDASGSRDDYFFRAEHVMVAGTLARRFQIRDVGCKGECRRPLPQSVFGPIGAPFQGVLALTGFKVFFTGNRDHHVDEIGVSFDDRDLVVTFNDKDDNDVFGYLVDFVRLSRVGQNITTGRSNGTTANGSDFPLPLPAGAEWVLRGFHFDFHDDDHHIRDVGVLRGGVNVKVIYADKNADDVFSWRIDWAHVSPQVVEG